MPDATPDVTTPAPAPKPDIPRDVFDSFVKIAASSGPSLAPSLVAPPETGIKPGYKTTEFWLTLGAMLGGIALQFMPDASPAAHYVGGILAVLSHFGYTASRNAQKLAA